jgi:hypothetical protein
MNQKTATKAVSPKIPRQVDEPLFDLKKASQEVAPGFNWNELSPSFTLDSCKLRRYVIKDIMYADAEIHEWLPILVSVEHVLF